MELCSRSTSDATSFSLTNEGDGTVQWSIQSISAAWLSATPTSGTLNAGQRATVNVSIDRGDLATGNHAAKIHVNAAGLDFEVAVSVQHTGTPLAGLAPASIELGPSDDSGEIQVRNEGDASLQWSLSGPDWIGLSPASGTTAAGRETRVVVTPSRADLDPGSHAATLELESNGGRATSALTVEVAAPAELRLDSSALDFGSNSTTRIVTLFNDGGLSLNWTARTSADWISLVPSSGSIEPGESTGLTVRASRDDLPVGAHGATLRIESNGGTKSLSVSLAVEASSPDDDSGSGGDDGGSGGSDGSDDPGDGGDTGGGGTVALEGRVIDQFGLGGLSGVTVEFDGETAVTDGSGVFQLFGTASSDLRSLELRGSGRVTRNTFARTGDDEWLVIPSSFNMNAFDDVAREYEPRTIRWTDDMDVYFDVTPPEGYPPGSELDVWIEEVRGVITSFISDWTNGRVRASRLTVGTSPPADGTTGVIVIGFSEDDDLYGNDRTVGLARTWWFSDRSIASGRIWLRFGDLSGSSHHSVRIAVVGHELGHTLGMGHMDGNTTSIMTPSISISSLSTFDQRTGDIVYSRSPGNSSPDNDNSSYYRGGLAPAGPGGLHEWVCGAGERVH